MRLHPDAAIRVLRKEIAYLKEGAEAYAEHLGDKRLPPGFVVSQLAQIDREHMQLLEAMNMLEAAWEASAGAAALSGQSDTREAVVA